MADEAKWVTFDSDSDEALSLSDLPNPKEESGGAGAGTASPTKDEQFEFRILAGAGAGGHSSAELVTMCAAEDVFFHGQLLPLGSASRSDSTASVSVDSSTSVSRSHSSNSCASSSDAPHSLSRIRSNTLYAYPSPKPRARPAGRNSGGRRSTGSAPPAGWGLLRLGVAMAPEMELSDIRVRLARGGSMKTVVEKRGNAVRRLLGGGLMGCKCSPEDAVSAKVLNAKKQGEGRRRVAGFMERRERMFEWLEELSLGKEPLMKFGL